MGEEGDLAEPRYGLATAHAARGEEAVAAAGVHHEARAQGPRLGPFADPDRGAFGVELDPLHLGRLEHAHAGLFRRVLEQDLIELGPRHLVAVVGPRVALAEVEAVLEVGLLVVEGRSVLDEETLALDPLANAETVEERQVCRQQRFSHVEAREDFSFRHRHA